MGLFAHVLLVAIVASLVLVLLACTGFLLSERFASGRLTAHVLAGSLTIAVAIVFAAALNHQWRIQRDRDAAVRGARTQHLENLHVLLRSESDALKTLAHGLRQGRYFTLVANDARQAIWPDEALSTDVERHYPEYFHERERLIHDILQYDTELGRIRHIVSASLPLPEPLEPSRGDLIAALVGKCAGAAPAFRRDASLNAAPARDGALQVYEQYRCAPDLIRVAQDLFDRAADLADAAVAASDAARRYVEETALRGACTYAPGE